MDTALTDFLSPAFGHRTAMLIASALAGAAMNWRHQAPKSPTEPIVTDIVQILVDGVKTRRLSVRPAPGHTPGFGAGCPINRKRGRREKPSGLQHESI